VQYRNSESGHSSFYLIAESSLRPNDSPLISKTIELGRDRSTDFGFKAYELCKGTGIEIGAVNCPFDLDADVIYLDQGDSSYVASMHASDPNVIGVLPVSLVAQKPPYTFLASNAFDFVVASHVIEHLANPLASISEFNRIIRPGGVVYLVVPHKDWCFDKCRTETPLQHFVTEFFSETSEISLEHYLEHIFDGLDLKNLSFCEGLNLVEKARSLFEKQLDFHIHTFSQLSFWALLDWVAPIIGAEVIYKHWNELHIHGALRKLAV
jgi:SAM-dependent methyltransferase